MDLIINFFNFLNDTFLKMTWLENLIGSLLTTLGMDPSSYLYLSTRFFFFDVIKIFLLLSILIFISSYIQARFTPEKTREALKGYRGIKGNIMGALLGTLTPFCSCSSIPIFIGFTQAGLPIGMTFSFLISSPLVDLASTVLLASIFGWPVALGYVVVGIILAVLGGTLIDALHLENEVEGFVRERVANASNTIELYPTRKEKMAYAWGQVRWIVKKVWVYVLIGVFIGAIIHGYIPEDWIAAVLGQSNPFSVFIATGVGVPMYADIFGTLPIAEALVAKGVGMGTVLAFMMSVTALSLPSMLLLKRVLKPKLLWTFFAVVVLGIIVTGYGFNWIQGWL